MTENPFGHERDVELGALLRSHLEADRHAGRRPATKVVSSVRARQ